MAADVEMHPEDSNSEGSDKAGDDDVGVDYEDCYAEAACSVPFPRASCLEAAGMTHLAQECIAGSSRPAQEHPVPMQDATSMSKRSVHERLSHLADGRHYDVSCDVVCGSSPSSRQSCRPAVQDTDTAPVVFRKRNPAASASAKTNTRKAMPDDDC
eukprot:gnl/TRDRNA2_/TRDRNA2_42596_c0_seq1.p1 gnl/TRDRNA2_/TRDRNA2_42596_c0~~gnl/TRDRNA2_/TRDRNA2_42596_c0_seq1.p1  ORF type:complete len:177 (+),score=38.45 gnl/TRDRNA2_/TRDRNA2_42596_c0_seq1:66-533(+)